MNRMTIINGLAGEGKTQELLALDYIAGLKGEIETEMPMKYYVVSGLDHTTTVALVEHLVDGMKESIPGLGEGVTKGVMTTNTIEDLEQIFIDHGNDNSSVFYIDATEYITGFTMEKLLELMDEYQFDCYVTRQRSKELR